MPHGKVSNCSVHGGALFSQSRFHTQGHGDLWWKGDSAHADGGIYCEPSTLRTMSYIGPTRSRCVYRTRFSCFRI